MVVPEADLLVFQRSLTVYVVPADIWITDSTMAALGEKVPAKPPLSFQATILPLTSIARSWLNPALAVKRSAFPMRSARVSAVEVTDKLKFVLSMSVQVDPSLLWSTYCSELARSVRPAPDGKNLSVSRVGENWLPIGPAPAWMVEADPALFVFHWSFVV